MKLGDIMLNNKGFAISIVLYSITAVVIVILLLIIGIDAANFHNTSNMTEEIKKEVSGLDFGE